MSDTFWKMLECPAERSLPRVSEEIVHVTTQFDADVYSLARGQIFSSFQDAYDDWRQFGRKNGLDFAKSKNTVLKIVLKVKDDIELIEKWIQYHVSIVGLHNIIIMDCGSTDTEFQSKLDKYRDDILIFEYKEYYDDLSYYPNNRDFFDMLARECKYICVIDTDEFILGIANGRVSPQAVVDILRLENSPAVGGVWIQNVAPPMTTAEGIIDWTKPILFDVGVHAITNGSIGGKVFVRSDCCEKAKHICHNLHNVSLSRMLTHNAFGRIGILHVSLLGSELTRKRTLKHLRAKHVIPDSITTPTDIEPFLAAKLHETHDTAVRAYINKYLVPHSNNSSYTQTWESCILDGRAFETAEISTIIQYNFGELIGQRRKELEISQPGQ